MNILYIFEGIIFYSYDGDINHVLRHVSFFSTVAYRKSSASRIFLVEMIGCDTMIFVSLMIRCSADKPKFCSQSRFLDYDNIVVPKLANSLSDLDFTTTF